MSPMDLPSTSTPAALPPFQQPRPNVLFDLDADPLTLSIIVQTYLSFLGWDDGGRGPPKRVDHTKVITLERMERGLGILKDAKAAGRGLFYDSFPPTRNPAYPYFTEDLYDLIRLVYERDPESHLPGELCRPYLILCNIALESPISVPPEEFPELVGCLYAVAHPIHWGANLAFDRVDIMDGDDGEDDDPDRVWIGEDKDLAWYPDSRFERIVRRELELHLLRCKMLAKHGIWYGGV